MQVKRSPAEELRDFLTRLGGARSVNGRDDRYDGPRARDSLRVPGSERDTRRTATALAFGGPVLLVAVSYLAGSSGALLYALGAAGGGALAYFVPPRPFKSFVDGSPSNIRPTPQNLLSPSELYVSIFLERDQRNAWLWGSISVVLALVLAIFAGDGVLGSGLLRTAAYLAALLGAAACTLGFAHAASLWRARLITNSREDGSRDGRS
jgi:hypothetical protein